MIDEHKEETASLYVFDLLEGAEKAAFETELARDPALRKQVDALRAASTQLALLAPSKEPSSALRTRILASASSVRSSRPADGNGVSGKVVRFSIAPVLGWAAAACFAVFTGLLATKVSRLDRELFQEKAAVALARNDLGALREALSAQQKDAEQALAQLRQQADVAELKVASLASLLGDSPKAQAIAVWNPLTQEGVLTVVNLPALQQDKDYQLWLVDPQYPTPVNGGVFRVDPKSGEARITFKPDRPVSTADKFAVSLERRGGVPKAEGPMVLINP